jgi:hypothetical protein
LYVESVGQYLIFWSTGKAPTPANQFFSVAQKEHIWVGQWRQAQMLVM